MKCKYCNADNSDDALFCTSCGKSLDMRRFCIKCGAQLETDARFCPECGAKVPDNITSPTESVAAVPSEPDATPAPVNVGPVGETDQAAPAWHKWMRTAGTVAGCIMLVISIVFFFLTTFRLTGKGFELDGDVADELSFSAFIDVCKTEFGKDSQPISDSLVINSETAVYLLIHWGVFGLQITIFAIVSLCKYINSITKGTSPENADKFAFITCLIYFAHVAILRSICAMEFSDGTDSVGYYADSVTVAGMVLAICCFVAVLATRMAVKGRQLLGKQKILSMVFCGISIVLSAIILSLVSGATIEIDDLGIRVSQLYYKMRSNEHYPFDELMFYIAAMVGLLNSICFSAYELADYKPINKRNGAKYVEIVVRASVICILIYMMIQIGATMREEKVDYTFGPMIAAVVLAVINLGVEIAHVATKQSELQPLSPLETQQA